MPNGFAARSNGSCLASEVDCGMTVSPFHACCPGGMYCPNAYNVACCETEANCTETIIKKPTCANQTWNLYDNAGYFCCTGDTTGAAMGNGINSDVCASAGYAFNGEESLQIVSYGHSESATTSTTSATSTSSTVSSTSTDTTSTATAQPTSSEASSSGTNSGAIAGGIVGGVAGAAILAGLVWFFLRRKSKNSLQDDVAIPINQGVKQENGAISELDGRHRASELASSPQRSELYGEMHQAPVYELPASHR